MSQNAIEFNNVSKKFKKGERFDSLRDLVPNMIKGMFSNNGKEELKDKEFWAVKDVSFELKRGEALGIIGPNGAGKSTILKLLTKILKPTKGEIKINGRLSALLEVGAGFHPDLTGKENIYLNGTIMGLKRREIDKKLDSIIEFSGLEDFIDTPVKRYSSGMYVRLGFAVVAHLEPEILLIDEILAVGDARFQKKCLEKMNEVTKEGQTIVFISHNMSAIQALCQKSMLIYSGCSKKIGNTQEIVKNYLTDQNTNFSVVPNSNSFINNKEIQLKDIKAIQDNKEANIISCRREFSIELEYEITQKVPHARFFLILRNGMGEVIFGTSDYDTSSLTTTDKHIGKILCSVNIPKNILKTGAIYITVGADVQGVKIIFIENDILKLEIFDDEISIGFDRHQRVGIIAPLINWESKYLN